MEPFTLQTARNLPHLQQQSASAPSPADSHFSTASANQVSLLDQVQQSSRRKGDLMDELKECLQASIDEKQSLYDMFYEYLGLEQDLYGNKGEEKEGSLEVDEEVQSNSVISSIQDWIEQDQESRMKYFDLLVSCLQLKLEITKQRIQESDEGKLAIYYR